MSWLKEYHSQIQEEKIIVGKELKTEINNLIRDIEEERYIFDTTESDKRIHFMENCVRLTKSPFYGKPMTLMLWQKAYIEAIYSFKMDDGTDRFKKVVLLIGRKNTKSETSSAMGLAELIMGLAGADIACSSNDDAQAKILYEATRTMKRMIDPKSKDITDNISNIKNLINGSNIFKLTSKMQNKDGRNIDFAIIDEVHEMKTWDILKAIEQSQSIKDNPKLIIISTEGFENEGVLDQLLAEGRKIISGEDNSISAERALYWLYTQDSEQEIFQDETSWHKSNPSLGVVKKYQYLREQVDNAKKSRSQKAYILTKDFNIKQNSSERWLDLSHFNYDKTFDPYKQKGKLYIGSADLAETTDLVATKAMVLGENGEKLIYQHYWICENKLENTPDTSYGAKYKEWAKEGYLTICEGNDVDITLAADWFCALVIEYGIKPLKVGYDSRFSKEFVKRLDEYGIESEVIPQNMNSMSNPMKLTEAEFMTQKVIYNNNPIDRWCLGNTAMALDNLGNVMAVKVPNMAGMRIDGAVALIILYEMYRRHRSYMQRVKEIEEKKGEKDGTMGKPEE